MKARTSESAISVRPLAPDDWPHLEALFGANGACGGCWCMYWRAPSPAAWEVGKGEGHRRAFRALVESGRAHGCLAFDGKTPVGWCAIGPRADFPRLVRGRATRTSWGDDAWAAPCFFIARTHRGRGVAAALLDGAAELAERLGAPALEGFPVRVAPGARYAATFAYVGVPSLFAGAGFEDVTPAGASRPVFIRRSRARS